MAEEVKKDVKQYKTSFYIGALLIAGLLIWFGTSATNKVEIKPSQEDPSSMETDITSKPTGSGDAETDIRRAIMVDTVAKWQDVDEFSLYVDKNSNTKYQGNYAVNIAANYNGALNNIEDTLTAYCNKIATAIDLTGQSVAELTLSWKVPDMPDDYNGTCHYHNKDGVLVYDNESNGILTVK